MGDFRTTVEAATTRLRALFPPTPLQKNLFLSEKYGADIYLKREDLSPIRSYKLRGAFNAMHKSLEQAPDRKLFVCASAGNHAQGVAFVCRHFGVQGVIFMPVTTPAQKVEKTRSFGGDSIQIILEGDYFDETLSAAQAYCVEHDGTFLAPFDDTDVIEGQATVGIEILEQLEGKGPDVVVVPVGGGGLSSGLVKLADDCFPETEFRFVEPAGGASLKAALAQGQPVTLDYVDNFVDGAAVARIGSKNFEILKNVNEATVLAAPEGRICRTISEILNVEGIVLEPAGALTIDALDDLASEITGKSVVCVTSGGNFDFERLPDVKERALRYSGLKKYFILKMPQRPGALRDFLHLLGPDDDIARFEYLKKSARNFGSVLLGIETKNAAQFETLCQRMVENGFVYQDITDDEILGQLLI